MTDGWMKMGKRMDDEWKESQMGRWMDGWKDEGTEG